jgi:hypothetical protein
MEGKHSVLQNLPCPPVSGSIKGHSYVSIVDCIRDFLGHTGTGQIAALDLESASNFSNNGLVSDTADSQHVATVMERACQKFTVPNSTPLVILLFFWSDDFEPNSMSKSMRGSAWIKTMTILTRKENGQSATHTYPIALGKKMTRTKKSKQQSTGRWVWSKMVEPDLSMTAATANLFIFSLMYMQRFRISPSDAVPMVWLMEIQNSMRGGACLAITHRFMMCFSAAKPV